MSFHPDGEQGIMLNGPSEPTVVITSSILLWHSWASKNAGQFFKFIQFCPSEVRRANTAALVTTDVSEQWLVVKLLKRIN